MPEAAAQRDVHDFHVAQAPEQFAPRARKADVTQCDARRLAETELKLALYCSSAHPGDGGKIRQTPLVRYILAHRVDRAAHNARQWGGI
jgi:hypothetical protein